jgi:hypothetical protein
VGCGVGFLFAAVAFSIGVASFPLLFGCDVGVTAAARYQSERLSQTR